MLVVIFVFVNESINLLIFSVFINFVERSNVILIKLLYLKNISNDILFK